jgi:hypothetical protein
MSKARTPVRAAIVAALSLTFLAWLISLTLRDVEVEPAPPDVHAVDDQGERVGARSEPRQQSDLSSGRTTAVETIRLPGRSVRAGGTPLACSISAGHDPSAAPTVWCEAGADGRFELEVPAAWTKVFLVANAGAGWSGQQLAVLGAMSEGQLIEVELTRSVDLTLRLELDEAVVQTLATTPGHEFRVALTGPAQGMFAVPKPIHGMAVERAGVFEDRVVVDGSEATMIQWRFRHACGTSFPVRVEPLPADVAAFTSELRLGLRDVLSGHIRRREDAGSLAGIPVVVVTRAPVQHRWQLLTDSQGRFSAVVAAHAHGELSSPWGGESVQWAAGEEVELPVPCERQVRLRIRTSDGAPLRKVCIRRHNQALRDQRGRLIEGPYLFPSEDGVVLTPWTGLSAGDRLFLSVDGAGECVHECGSDIGPGTVHDCVFVPPKPGSVKFSCQPGAPSATGIDPIIGVHLVERADRSPPVHYRLAFRRSSAASGWTALAVIPGEYDVVVSVGRREQPARRVVVVPGGVTEVKGL